jgi:hypothetical protein
MISGRVLGFAVIEFTSVVPSVSGTQLDCLGFANQHGLAVLKGNFKSSPKSLAG